MKLVNCPDCNGEGTLEDDRASWCGLYLATHDIRCERCNGFGKVTQEEVHEKD